MGKSTTVGGGVPYGRGAQFKLGTVYVYVKLLVVNGGTGII